MIYTLLCVQFCSKAYNINDHQVAGSTSFAKHNQLNWFRCFTLFALVTLFTLLTVFTLLRLLTPFSQLSPLTLLTLSKLLSLQMLGDGVDWSG